MQQWNEGLRRKMAAMAEERGNIWQVLQEDYRAENRKANSHVFD
jgi:hypothetical protein